MASQCTGCGAPLPWPWKSCGACAQEFFKQLHTPQPLQKSDEIQKVDKEPPKPTRKPRTNTGYRLSCNVCESDRKVILAQRALRYLEDAGGRSSLHGLYRAMNAHRYKSLWRTAAQLLVTTGAAQISGRQVVLTGNGDSLSRWRLRRRRKHRPRSRGQSAWFRAHVLGF
jgi:hypothetical protein